MQLADLLDRAGVKPEATALRFMSFDGEYTESLTLDQARRGRRDRRVRAWRASRSSAITAGRCACTSRRCTATSRASGSSGIELTDDVEPGYWENDGYDVDGWVGRSNGRDDAPTSRREPRHVRRFPRFDRVERVVHWCTATLFLILLFTGASLYVGPLSTLVGTPRLVRTIHVYVGLAAADPGARRDLLAAGRQLRRRSRAAQSLDARRSALVVAAPARERCSSASSIPVRS